MKTRQNKNKAKQKQGKTKTRQNKNRAKQKQGKTKTRQNKSKAKQKQGKTKTRQNKNKAKQKQKPTKQNTAKKDRIKEIPLVSIFTSLRQCGNLKQFPLNLPNRIKFYTDFLPTTSGFILWFLHQRRSFCLEFTHHVTERFFQCLHLLFELSLRIERERHSTENGRT